MAELGDRLLFIVANRDQSGKTTLSRRASKHFGVPYIASSQVVREVVEAERGLTPGSVVSARALDPDAYRPELIETGDRMMAAGTPPGVICVQRGHRIIDGLRRAGELEAACAEARRRGMQPLVIFVERPTSAERPANAEANALRQLADAVIANDADLPSYLARIETLLEQLSSGLTA